MLKRAGRIKTIDVCSVKSRTKTVVNVSKMVSFGCAVSNFFKKYFKFNGVATRAEYWWVNLFIWIVVLASITVVWFLQPVNLLLAGFIAMLCLLFVVIIIVPFWAVMARRLHDVGITAKLLWINFVFFVCFVAFPDIMRGTVMYWVHFGWGIVMLLLALLPSKVRNNPYRD